MYYEGQTRFRPAEREQARSAIRQPTSGSFIAAYPLISSSVARSV